METKTKTTERTGFTTIKDNRCRFCGRPLKNPKSVKDGMGPQCYKLHKSGAEPTYLKNETAKKYMVPVADDIAIPYIEQLKRLTCKNCEFPFQSKPLLFMYESPQGYNIPGLLKKQKLVIICNKCCHPNPIEQLGVPREKLEAIK